MEEANIFKNLERSTFRTYYRDGIFDLVFGSMLLIYCLNMYLDSKGGETSFIITILIIPVAIVLAVVKKFLTSPRIGYVKFRKVRNKKRLKAMILATAALVLTTVVYYFAARGAITSSGKNSVLPLILEFIFLVGLFSLLAYYTDYYDFYTVGLAMGLGSPLATLFQPLTGSEIYGKIILFAAGLYLLMKGIYNFSTFFSKFPKHVNHEG